MKENWTVKKLKEVKLRNAVMIEGLPGIGNVGKIAVDFVIEALNAHKILEIYSYSFANCAFVNDDGVSELPKIEVYYKKYKTNDLFLVSGDVQPVDEVSSYEFCDNLLDLFESYGGKEVVSLGGMGLEEIPRNAAVYCAGTDKKTIERYKINGIKIAGGVVGPIIGVSGLLVGLAGKRGMKGVTLLVETYGHPTYLGVKEARELLKVLNTKFKLKLDMNALDKEVKTIEKEIKEKVKKIMTLQDDKSKKREAISYIG